jgi:glutamate-1-semialdehyde 2,1-aminomutase
MANHTTFPDPESNSAKLWRRACDSLPGGSTRHMNFYLPYPIFAASANGCRITDVDGNERVDFVNNYTVQIHGHCHPEIVAAVQAQVEQAICFTMPTELEIELAEILCSRTESIEKVRFANSGTEAVMNAIKAARAYTGRSRIAKCEGVYHGSYDYAEVSLDPDPQNWGSDDPVPIGFARGEPEGMLRDVVVIPFNDVENTRRILEAHAESLAGVLFDIVPSRCGGLPASREYMDMLREVTRKIGALLICDEVVTYRLHEGGGQTLYGLDPDLTTLGKVIGGGLPIGAICGRTEFMAVFDTRKGKPALPHSGTFTANPLTMAAGIVAMRMLTQDVIDELNAKTRRFRDQIDETFKIAGMPGRMMGEGSLMKPYMSDEPLGSYRQAFMAENDAARAREERMFVHLLNNGVFYSLHLACTSTPMGEAEFDQTAEAWLAGLRAMREEGLEEAAS